MASWLLGFRFLDFLVSCFVVSWFLGFNVSLFQNFKHSYHVLGALLVPYYKISISCSLEDIDPISKIFKNILNGSSDIFGARLFQNFQMFDLQNVCD